MAAPNNALAPSYQHLIARLASRSDEFGAAILTELINAHPVYWGWFPPNREAVAHALGRALTHVLTAQAEHHGMTRATHRFLRHLAEDHRSFGVEAEHYEHFGPAIVAALHRLVPSVKDEDLALFQMAVATIVSTMAGAAEDFRNVMVRWPATVKEVRRCGPSMMIVRVAVEHGPVPFQPGQYVPLSLPQMRGRRVLAVPCDLAGPAGTEVVSTVRSIPRRSPAGPGGGAVVGHVSGSERTGAVDHGGGAVGAGASPLPLERPQDLEFHFVLSEARPQPGHRDEGQSALVNPTPQGTVGSADNLTGHGSESRAAVTTATDSTPSWPTPRTTTSADVADSVAPPDRPHERSTQGPSRPTRPHERVSEHLLRMTRPGDTWEIGIPRGEITAATVLDAATAATAADVDLLLVCDAAGWMTQRVLILENMATERPRRIHVIWAGDNPTDLYDLRWLWGMASAFDWLSFDAVVRSEKLPRYASLPPEASAPVELASWWILPDFIRHRIQLNPTTPRHDPRRLSLVGGIAVVAGEEAAMRPIGELLNAAGMSRVFMN